MKPLFKALGVTILILLSLKLIRYSNLETQALAFQLLLLFSVILSTLLTAFYATLSLAMHFNISKNGKRKCQIISK